MNFDWNAILLFTALNTANVIVQTIKSLTTIKGTKVVAGLTNALAYGLYTFVVVYMTMDILNIWVRAGIIALTNFFGVFLVRWVEDILTEDKLWKLEVTIPTKYTKAVDFDLRETPHSYITLSDKHTVFNFYCSTKEDTKKVKDITSQYGAKFFASEAKNI